MKMKFLYASLGLLALTILLIIFASLSSSPPSSDELSIPTDPHARYFVIEKAGTTNQPTLATKRVESSGSSSYAKRIFDCRAGTTKYLVVDSETLEGLKSLKPEKRMYPIVKESIAWYQYRQVCPEEKASDGDNPPSETLTLHRQAAVSAIEKAQIAQKEGDHTRACVYLGIATSALLEAKDTKNYKQWLKMEQSACNRVGEDDD